MEAPAGTPLDSICTPRRESQCGTDAQHIGDLGSAATPATGARRRVRQAIDDEMLELRMMLRVEA